MAAKYPERAVFWASVNPLEGKTALDLLERQVKEHNAKAIKLEEEDTRREPGPVAGHRH